MTRYTPLWLQAGSYAASVDRRLLGALWPTPASAGCAVTTASSGMTVNIAAGQVAVPTQNNTGTTLCSSDAVEQVTISAAPGAGLNRIDLIICRPRGNDLDGGANTDFIFDYVTGAAAATPTVPATPAGTVALAQIAVPGGSASIAAGSITDVRPGGLAAANAARYAARYFPAATTSPATVNQIQQINLGIRVYDQANAVAGNVYTCPAAGRYLARVSASAPLPAGQSMSAFVRRNGATDSQALVYNSTAASVVIIAQTVNVIMCAAGDTIDAAWQVSAASVVMRITAPESSFAVDYLGPA